MPPRPLANTHTRHPFEGGSAVVSRNGGAVLTGKRAKGAHTRAKAGRDLKGAFPASSLQDGSC
jgi:hypothetical protein